MVGKRKQNLKLPLLKQENGMLSLLGKISDDDHLVVFFFKFKLSSCLLFRPEGRTFRSKQEIKHYLTIRQLSHDLELFDFRLGENFYTSRGLEVPVRARMSTVRTPTPAVKKTESEVTLSSTSASAVESASYSTSVNATPESSVADKTLLSKPPTRSESAAAGSSAEIETPTFVPEEDGYRCPVEDCRKLFRRDNLLGVRENYNIS